MATEGWTVYIIRTESGKLYTGITTDLDRRFTAHEKKRAGARFFRISGPECVVYKESCYNRSEASKREAEIKKMSRSEKLALIGRRP